MSGFFSDDRIKVREADERWKKSERDWVLDTHLAGGEGASPRHMAQHLGRTFKSVMRLIEQFTANERDRVLLYEPFRRTSRKGKKFTQNELVIWKSHTARGVPIEATARLFCRDVEELAHQTRAEASASKARTPFAPTLDLIWAHRYIYFVYKKPILSDEAYDNLVKEEIEFGGGERTFARIKNHQGWPDHIKALALYLVGKSEGER